jgi:hypothetical protein
LNMIQKKYGLAELMRRVQKGTVLVRADPVDPEEYEFQDVRKVDTDAQCEMNVANVQKKDKIAFEDYIKAKSASSLGDMPGSGSAAQVFLNSVKGAKSTTPALGNGGDDEYADDEAEDDHSKAKAFEDAADKLTQFQKLGAKGLTAGQRVDAMLKVLLEMMKSHPKNKDKDIHNMLNKRVQCLQNLKKNKNLDLDTCKTVLMDAAQIIKKVNKLG